MRTELVSAALDAAIVRRRPGTDLIHHSDHGTQYTSLAFGRRLRESGIAASMGSIGDCYDNALAESFFATLETELIDRSDWADQGGGQGRRLRLHRGLLQPDPPPQQPRQAQSRAVRGALSFKAGHRRRMRHHRPRNRGNSTQLPRASPGLSVQPPGVGRVMLRFVRGGRADRPSWKSADDAARPRLTPAARALARSRH